MWLGFLSTIRNGSLHVHLRNGHVIRAGRGQPEAHVVLHRDAALPRMLLHPEITVGESYVAGDWDPGEGGLLRVFEVVARNRSVPRGFLGWLRSLRGRATEWNTASSSRHNAQRHYDTDEALFRRFLDADLHYSCAYFQDPGMTLEEAQQAKCRHVAGKLLLRPGETVLDIGSGWGGVALYLARTHGVQVTGLTLSRDQHRASQQRAWERGLGERARFLLEDYRDHRGSYDAVVSIGMFEHVGRPQYQVFFDRVAQLLKPRGRALLHTIGRSGPPVSSRQWIQKHIFPGSYIPALSELMRPVELSGLVLTDAEILHTHYALTLKYWHQRFQAARADLAGRLGEEFCRMWEFYLQASEAMFRWGDLVVFQLQLARDKCAVPMTRDYLHAPAGTMTGPRKLRGGGTR